MRKSGYKRHKGFTPLEIKTSKRRNKKLLTLTGFTLVELLVALMVTSVILTAVATLAYALGAANDASDDTSQKQARVRYATFRISELIRHCKLICGTPGGDLAIWQADDNGNDQVNVNELVYLSRGAGGDHIRLYECENVSNPEVALSDIDSVGSAWWLGFYDSGQYIGLINQCSNVEFLPDAAAPQTQFVRVTFDLEENGVAHNYEISAGVRGWSGHLLDGGGNIVSDDD